MRVLKIIGGVVLALVVALVLVVYGFVRGWHVDRLEPAELSALLRPFDEVVLPEGDGPSPTVILFHGCGGKRRDFSTWAKLIRDRGYVAIVVDSNTPRGLDSTTGCGLLTAPWGAERAGDVLVTLDDVRKLPFVDPERIVLAGWSSGAWAVMELLVRDAPGALPTNLSSVPEGGLAGVAGVVLFYPGCRSFPWTSDPWSLEVPVLFLLGGADLNTGGAEGCVEFASELEADRRPVTVHVYEGIGHAWDISDISPGHNHVYDAPTTEDSRERLWTFLHSLPH